MLTIEVATKTISADLSEAEIAVEHALSSVGALMASATLARANHHDVAASCGHTAMLRINKSIEGLLSARAELMRAHKSLAEDARVHAGVEEPDCPEYKTGKIQADEPKMSAA